MNITKEQVLTALRSLFTQEQVITEESVLKEYDSDNRNYAKSHGVYAAPLPICILNVTSVAEVSKALKYCNENAVAVIPRTGASSGEGLLTAINGDVIVLDASSMNKVLKTDFENMCVTCQCGVPLSTLEESLQAKGYTTGHSPQSLPVAQMGGLVATRSTGQFSTYYGGIEDLICGLEAVMPNGQILRIRNVPRRSAGPDLRHLFLGCEGALAFITEVTVKIFTYYPNNFWKGGFIVSNIDTGFKTIQKIIAAGYRPSVVRLYDKADFDYNFGSVTLEEGEAYMFFVAEGPPAIAAATGAAINEFARAAGAKFIGEKGVEHWLIHRNDICSRFKNPEQRQYYRENPYYYSTTEVSASYTDIAAIYKNIIQNVPKKVDNLVLLGGHVSHAYQTGLNVYFVYRIKMSAPEKAHEAHQALVDALCEEVLKAETGGCVHHHGMGKNRVKFAPTEHGTSYFLMKDIKKMMDPNGIMNPGVLVEK